MPRLDAMEQRAARPRSGSRSARSKKPAQQQDRLSQRTLVWRRFKRGIRPGLWIFGVVAVLIVGGELIRSLPSAPASHAVPQVASSVAAPPVAVPAPVIRPGLLAEALAGLGFKIDKIEINGTSTATPAAVAAALGVKDGDPIFGFSLKAAQQRIQALGPVQSAVIERLLPGTLVVNVTERDVYAIWQTIQNGRPVFQIIDSKGNVIPGQDAAEAKRREPSLLLLSGAGAPQQASALIPELKAVPSVFSHVAAAERVDELRWNLILKNHTVVKLPAENEQAALNELAALQNSMQLLDRPVEAIDLRQAGRLVVQPYMVAPPSHDKTDHSHNHADLHQEGQ